MVVTIGRDKSKPIPDKGMSVGKTDVSYLDQISGLFTKKLSRYYVCNAWKGHVSYRTNCGYVAKRRKFIRHLVDFHEVYHKEVHNHVNNAKRLRD